MLLITSRASIELHCVPNHRHEHHRHEAARRMKCPSSSAGVEETHRGRLETTIMAGDGTRRMMTRASSSSSSSSSAPACVGRRGRGRGKQSLRGQLPSHRLAQDRGPALSPARAMARTRAYASPYASLAAGIAAVTPMGLVDAPAQGIGEQEGFGRPCPM